MRISTLLRTVEDKSVALAAKVKAEAIPTTKYHAARARTATASALRTVARKVDAAHRMED